MIYLIKVQLIELSHLFISCEFPSISTADGIHVYKLSFFFLTVAIVPYLAKTIFRSGQSQPLSIEPSIKAAIVHAL